MITIDINITSVGVQRRDAFIPSGVNSRLYVCMYVYMSIYHSVSLYLYLVIQVAF